MLTIRRVTVEGFRGIASPLSLDFNAPAVFFFGENHCGKSSILNAIEWCLYGADAVGKDTGIRERTRWEVANRYYKGPGARTQVAVELVDRDGRVVEVERTLSGRGRSKGGSLTVRLPDGTVLHEEEAEERLAQLIGLSFDDFKCAIYQHQEAVRALLVDEPRNRNEAFDRLLGTYDMREFLSSLQTFKESDIKKEANNLRSTAGSTRKIRVEERRRELDDWARRLREEGFDPDTVTFETARGLAENLLADLDRTLSRVELAEPLPPVPQSIEGMKPFFDRIVAVAERARMRVPDALNARTLSGQLADLEALRTRLDETAKRLEEERASLRGLLERHGDPRELEASIRQLEQTIEELVAAQTIAQRQGTLMKDAIEYVERAAPGSNECPVCGTPIENLAGHLKDRHAALQHELVERQHAALQSARDQKEAKESALRGIRKEERVVASFEKEMAELRDNLAHLIGRALAPDDDPAAVIARQISAVRSQLDSIRKELDRSTEALRVIAEDATKGAHVSSFLDAQERFRRASKPADPKLERAVDNAIERASRLTADVETIRLAIAKLATEIADEKVTRARHDIDRFFFAITSFPAASHISLQVSTSSRDRKNEYRLLGDDGRDIEPILSQGDYNALALAIFLALGGELPSSTLGFIMLDDPSQSLGSEHKRRLAEVLAEAVARRQLIVATMDVEFQDALRSAIEKLKLEYTVSSWSKEAGPKVELR